MIVKTVSYTHLDVYKRQAFEGRYNSKVYVDDVNSDAAPSYTIFGYLQNRLGKVDFLI